MNGVHDMGGMHGFGPVRPEKDEPVFHEPWEGRVYAMLREIGARFAPPPIGGNRDIIENMGPVRYLTASYYERFLEVLEQRALREGVVSETELAARTEQFRLDPGTPLPRREDAAATARSLERLHHHQNRPAEHGVAQRFNAGDEVRVRNLNWAGHNRLPRYLRGKRGVIERVNGLYHIEDAHAGAWEPLPQTVYTVQFSGLEVWGAESEPNLKVYAELWEGYLEEVSQ
jgi:nitrile hydratase